MRSPIYSLFMASGGEHFSPKVEPAMAGDPAAAAAHLLCTLLM